MSRPSRQIFINLIFFSEFLEGEFFFHGGIFACNYYYYFLLCIFDNPGYTAVGDVENV